LKDRFGPLNVVVATITRRRPQMLCSLLESWSRLERPPACDCAFLVIENDDHQRTYPPASLAAGDWSGAELVYFLESRQGIPIARNRGAEIAQQRNADLLLFIDDDEVADPRWLAGMIEAYRSSDCVLIGGPVRAQPPLDELTFWQHVVFRSVRERLARKEAGNKAKSRTGNIAAVTIVTNNWLADTALFSRHGLSFDERLVFSGGSDAKFSDDVKAKGLKIGWAPSAVVHETISSDRLSLLYQFRRGRDQSNASFRRKIEKHRANRFSILISVPLKLTGAILLALLVPLTGGSSLVPMVRTAGWIVGRLSVFCGAVSNHYAKTTGH
jgi:succinoglycan biosynthesis protein ExoM